MTGRHRADLAPVEPATPPRKRKKRPTTNRSFAAMLIRMSRAYALRVGDDVDALAFLPAIDQAHDDAVNLGVFLANRRADGHAVSLAAIGERMGISKQAVAKRVALGRVVAERMMAEGRLTGPAGGRPGIDAPAHTYPA